MLLEQYPRGYFNYGVLKTLFLYKNHKLQIEKLKEVSTRLKRRGWTINTIRVETFFLPCIILTFVILVVPSNILQAIHISYTCFSFHLPFFLFYSIPLCFTFLLQSFRIHFPHIANYCSKGKKEHPIQCCSFRLSVYTQKQQKKFIHNTLSSL